MATQPETYLKLRAFKKLDKLDNCWYFKVQTVAIHGIPDILGVRNGRFFAWELKLDGKRPSKIQRYVLARIVKCGGIAEVVYPSTLNRQFEELTQITSS